MFADKPCQEPRKGIILHAGAIGDCLLTLPLAAFIKRTCGLTQMHYMGRLDAAGFYSRRSCIDFVRAMESVPLHRLFEPQAEFTLDDPDRLIAAFMGYEQVVSFLGAGHPDYEQNLLMTVLSSHSAEVTTLPLAPPAGDEHISAFYIRSFAEQIGIEAGEVDLQAVWLTATSEDQWAGRDRLQESGIDPDASVAVIHPGSGGRHKCWHFENFICLSEELSGHGVQPLFLFGPAEEERLGPEIRGRFQKTAPVFSELELAEVLQILSQADVFIGNDSGISHMAGAMGKKTCAIFGPTNSRLYRPLGPSVTVFEAQPEGFQCPCPADLNTLLEKLSPLI